MGSEASPKFRSPRRARAAKPSTVRGKRGKKLARAIVALASTAVLVGLLSRDRAEADPGAGLLPEGLHLPSASILIPLSGEIEWNGMAAEKLLFHSNEAPEAIVDHFRAQWEGRPVEWVEGEIAEGSALVVYDFHAGRRWSIVARRNEEGSTEVIRSIAPLSTGTTKEAALPFELPEGLILVSRMGDSSGGRRLHTALAVEGERDDSIDTSICRALAMAGWEGHCEFSDRMAGIEALQFEREDERLTLGFGEGALDKRWLSIRWEER